MKILHIYGASGHAKVVAETFMQDSKGYDVLFLDDDLSKDICLGRKILNNTDCLKDFQGDFVVGIGYNNIRKIIVEKIISQVRFTASIKHATSVISNSAVVGDGTVVLANAVINAEAFIGKHVIVNTAAVIEHDCVVQDYAHISPGALLAGNVFVGEGSHIGIGAQIIQGVKIGKWCTIGAGTVVIKDVPDGAKVVGNPGRIINK